MEVLYMFLVTAFIVSLTILISLAIFKMTCGEQKTKQEQAAKKRKASKDFSWMEGVS